jgi:hypothetical protein
MCAARRDTGGAEPGTNAGPAVALALANARGATAPTPSATAPMPVVLMKSRRDSDALPSGSWLLFFPCS